MGFDFIKTLNPDPVFLLNELCRDSWDPLYNDIKSKQYYIISLPTAQSGAYNSSMKKWLKNFKKTVNLNGYKLVELPLPDGASGLKDFDHSIPYPIDPLQWFLWIKNAKAYIGLRFHPIVSCISAGTPFFSLDGYGYLPP